MAGHKNVYDLHNLTALPRPSQVSPVARSLQTGACLGTGYSHPQGKHALHFLSPFLSSLLCFCVDKELINYGPYIMEIYRCCLGSLFYGPAEFYDPWQSRLFIDLLDGVANFEDSTLSRGVSMLHTRRSAVNQGQRAWTAQQREEGEKKGEVEREELPRRQSLIVLDLWPSLIWPATRVDTSSSALARSPSPSVSLAHSPLAVCLTNNFIDVLCLVFNCPASYSVPAQLPQRAARDNCSFYDAFVKSARSLSPSLSLSLCL